MEDKDKTGIRKHISKKETRQSPEAQTAELKRVLSVLENYDLESLICYVAIKVKVSPAIVQRWLAGERIPSAFYTRNSIVSTLKRLSLKEDTYILESLKKAKDLTQKYSKHDDRQDTKQESIEEIMKKLGPEYEDPIG